MIDLLIQRYAFPTTLGEASFTPQSSHPAVPSLNQEPSIDITIPTSSPKPIKTTSEIMKSIIEDVDLLQNISHAMGIPSGYVAASVFDTNKDPSNVTTSMTILAGSVLQHGSTYLIGKALGKPGSLEISDENAIADGDLYILLSKNVQTQLNTLKAEQDYKQNSNTQTFVKNIEDVLETIQRQRYITLGLTLASAAANGYHGYKRNNGSVGYGLAWALFGGLSGTGVALEQGFAKPSK